MLTLSHNLHVLLGKYAMYHELRYNDRTIYPNNSRTLTNATLIYQQGFDTPSSANYWYSDLPFKIFAPKLSHQPRPKTPLVSWLDSQKASLSTHTPDEMSGLLLTGLQQAYTGYEYDITTYSDQLKN